MDVGGPVVSSINIRASYLVMASGDLARIYRRDGVVLVRSGMKGEGKTL